jgi:hypothetical protein
LPNQWNPSPKANKFKDGGFSYTSGGQTIHGHGKNIDAPEGTYAANNPTASITKGKNRGKEYYRTDGTWGRLESDRAGAHLPLDHSPFKE